MNGPGPLSLVLPGNWGARSAGPAGATAVQIGAAEAILSQDGRELRIGIANGDVLDLLQAALALHAGIPASAWPGTGDMVDGPVATGAVDAVLQGRMRPGEALAAMLDAGLRHLLANARGAGAGHVEAIHQARVGLRRLRAVLALFQPLLRPEPEAAVQDELGQLSRVLGQARDWDVFCLDILPGLPDDAAPERDRQSLQDAAGARRPAAHADVARALAAPEVAALAARLAAWITEELATPGTALGQGRLKHTAPALLARLDRKLRQRARHIARHSEEEMHTVRKSLKKLRYGVAFLGPLFEPKAVKTYLRACESLQERLGTLNDLANAAHLARELGADLQLSAAAVALATYLDRRKTTQMAAARHDWATFAQARPFWT